MRDNWQLWEGALTPQRCEEIKNSCYNEVSLTDATIFSSGDFHPDRTVRDTKIGWIQTPEVVAILKDYANRANRLAFGFDVDYLPPVQFGEYSKGSYYHWHYDINWNADSMYDRKLSISVQLSDPSTYQGGDFEFESIENPIKFKTQGSILVFPSYNVHRVTEITEGTRNSLVGWMEGPRWR